MSDNTVDQFEEQYEYTPLSVSAVPSGWRAIYKLEEPEPGRRDWKAIPLIGWGVFRLTIRRGAKGDEWFREWGNVVEGVVIGGFGSPACALETPNFLFYLGPDDPDPEPGELNRAVRQPGTHAPA